MDKNSLSLLDYALLILPGRLRFAISCDHANRPRRCPLFALLHHLRGFRPPHDIIGDNGASLIIMVVGVAAAALQAERGDVGAAAAGEVDAFRAGFSGNETGSGSSVAAFGKQWNVSAAGACGRRGRAAALPRRPCQTVWPAGRRCPRVRRPRPRPRENPGSPGWQSFCSARTLAPFLPGL